MPDANFPIEKLEKYANKRLGKLLEKRPSEDAAYARELPYVIVAPKENEEDNINIVFSQDYTSVTIYGSEEILSDRWDNLKNKEKDDNFELKKIVKKGLDEYLNIALDNLVEHGKTRLEEEDKARENSTVTVDFTEYDPSLLYDPDWETNDDDSLFRNDVTNNCNIPLNEEYCSYSEFLDEMKPRIASYMCCDIDRVLFKENSDSTHYLMSIEDEENGAPWISLNEHYRLYRTSEESENIIFEALAKNIADIYTPIKEDYLNQKPAIEAAEKMADYEEVKENILPFLVEKPDIDDTNLPFRMNASNDNLVIKDTPYGQISFKAVVGRENSGDCWAFDKKITIPVTKDIMDTWGISEDTLYNDAVNNLTSSDIYMSSLSRIIEGVAEKIDFSQFYVCCNSTVLLSPEKVKECLDTIDNFEDKAIIIRTSPADIMFFNDNKELFNQIVPACEEVCRISGSDLDDLDIWKANADGELTKTSFSELSSEYNLDNKESEVDDAEEEVDEEIE